MTAAPYLSLIVPVHNGANYIAENVREMLRVLEELEEPFELIVVCDGCTDETATIVTVVEDPRVRVLHYERNRGKGYAICFGFSRAKGQLIGYLDADLDIDPRVILDAAECFRQAPVDAVIASKRHPASEVDYPRVRRVFSWGFQMLVRVLFRISVRDTQVGAKLFRRETLEVVAPLLLIKQYAFDLELLAVSAEFGFDRIEEIPVRIDYRFTGTGISTQAVRRMFVDTLAIAYRIYLRHWYVRQFAALQRERTDAQTKLGAPTPVPASSTLSEILSSHR